MKNIPDMNAKIEKVAVNAYKKIENTTVSCYKKIESGALHAYGRISDFCIQALFSRSGETLEETKKRLSGEKRNG